MNTGRKDRDGSSDAAMLWRLQLISSEVTTLITSPTSLLVSVSGAIAGALMYRPTVRQLDRRSGERSAECERVEIRAAVASIHSDLDLSQPRLRKALANDAWHSSTDCRPGAGRIMGCGSPLQGSGSSSAPALRRFSLGHWILGRHQSGRNGAE
jgi:hypothetical protein